MRNVVLAGVALLASCGGEEPLTESLGGGLIHRECMVISEGPTYRETEVHTYSVCGDEDAAAAWLIRCDEWSLELTYPREGECICERTGDACSESGSELVERSHECGVRLHVEPCDGGCIDLLEDDPLNCGGCGVVCAEDEWCVQGACIP